MQKYFYVLCLLFFLAACGGSKNESGKKDTHAENNPEATAAAGKAIYSTCASCHGENAEGNQALNAPALANQLPWYLKRQLQHFKNDVRGADENDVFGKQMSPMAKSMLSDSVKIDQVVAYINTLPKVSTAKTIEGNIENGRKHYNMICGSCHSSGAAGNTSLQAPKLVGLNDWYLERQYKNFLSGIRGAHKEDKYGAQMKQIATSLSAEQDIKDVIAYIQSLEK